MFRLMSRGKEHGSKQSLTNYTKCLIIDFIEAVIISVLIILVLILKAVATLCYLEFLASEYFWPHTVMSRKTMVYT